MYIVFFRKFINVLNKDNENDIYNISILDLSFCPKHIKIVYVLSTITDYYLLMASIYYSINCLIKSHRESKILLRMGGIRNTKDIENISLNPSDETEKRLADEYLRLYKYQVEEIKKYYTMMKNARKNIIEKN